MTEHSPTASLRFKRYALFSMRPAPDPTILFDSAWSSIVFINKSGIN